MEDLLETDTAGDPMDKDRIWSRKSTYTLSEDLAEKNVNICPNSVGKLLKDVGYSLRCCRKSIAETKHPDRDRQFGIIAEQRQRFEDNHQPIISVDTKKRELVGNFSNKGKRYRRKSEHTLVHDFRSCAVGVAIPYGIYDVQKNLGTVVVGTSYDTPEFAMDAVHAWLTISAVEQYRDMHELLILADTGGSNGAQPRMWKHALHHRISKKYGVRITVCHYPSGASKWNPVEHRLFGPISHNWQGEPLRNYETILGLIGSTRTTTGLCVQAILNEKNYERGIKISDSEMRSIKIKHGDCLEKWNYTIG